MKPRRDHYLLVRVSKQEKRALDKAAAALDMPAAQLMRRGLKWVLREWAHKQAA